jgi:hypothetical protein
MPLSQKGIVLSSPHETISPKGLTRVVNVWFASGVFRHGQALPLHPGVEHPQNEVKEAMIADFAPRTLLGHREVREDKFVEFCFSQLHRNGRDVGMFGGGTHHRRASCEEDGFAPENPDFSTYYKRFGPFAKLTTSSIVALAE